MHTNVKLSIMIQVLEDVVQTVGSRKEAWSSN